MAVRGGQADELVTPGADELDQELDRLYGLPLAQFTEARNAAARELKGSGDADAARQVKGLKKPTRSAGAINRAVRERRGDAKKLLAAAQDLRAAQEAMLQGGGREPVEEATERERDAIERFMGAVEEKLEEDGGTSPAMLERARSTLQALPGDPELQEEFEAGRIVKDHEAVGFGGLTVEPAAKAKPREPDPKRDEKRRLKQAERELETAEKRLQRARGRAEKAMEQLEATRAAVEEAEEAVAAATKARDEAKKAAS